MARCLGKPFEADQTEAHSLARASMARERVLLGKIAERERQSSLGTVRQRHVIFARRQTADVVVHFPAPDKLATLLHRRRLRQSVPESATFMSPLRWVQPLRMTVCLRDR